MLCDLHLHTSKSDGVFEPARLFDEIRDRGLLLFSVTDHDCLDAYPVPADLAAKLIPGLEVDSEHAGHTVHVLAYGVQDKQSPLLRALAAQRSDRHARMQTMVQRLCELGFHVTMDDVFRNAPGATSLGRPHLARALVNLGHATSVSDAFERFLADDAPGYSALRRLTARQIIDLIHESGGVAIVAHPMRLRAASHLEELIELGVDGIEVTHPTASIDDERNLRMLARENDLLVTGGTDFHAPVPGRPIGVDFPEEDLFALQSRLSANATA